MSLVDKTHYVWWKMNDCTTANTAPFYCKTLPPPHVITAWGTNCAGMINILQLARGLPVPGVQSDNYYAGGTAVWFNYLQSINALIPFDPDASYPAGSLLLRDYRTPEDQGHVAVLYTSGPVLEQQVIHSYPDAGIHIDSTVRESHNWVHEGYYTHVCVDWYHSPPPQPTI